jgi:hypothetical protein
LTTFDLIPQVLQLLSHVSAALGGTRPGAWQPDSFRAVEGNWRLHQGKILTEHLRLRGQGLEALLTGYIGLDQAIDYAGTVFLPATLLGRRQDEAKRLAVPFTAQGTLTTPRIVVDEQALVGLVQTELVDALGKQLGSKLEELFGRPSASDQRQQESDRTGQGTGDRPLPPNLPGKLLRELLRR